MTSINIFLRFYIFYTRKGQKKAQFLIELVGIVALFSAAVYESAEIDLVTCSVLKKCHLFKLCAKKFM